MAQTNLTRIPENTFTVMNTETAEYHAIVSQPISGTFKLTQFALYQILAGGACSSHFSEELKQHGLVFITNLMSSLAIYAINTNNDLEKPEIGLLRGDVEIMKGLLEARMRHCEYERDQMKETFNPDTYISQKLLLLDIREWLMCHSIQIEKPVDKKVASKSIHEDIFTA